MKPDGTQSDSTPQFRIELRRPQSADGTPVRAVPLSAVAATQLRQLTLSMSEQLASDLAASVSPLKRAVDETIRQSGSSAAVSAALKQARAAAGLRVEARRPLLGTVIGQSSLDRQVSKSVALLREQALASWRADARAIAGLTTLDTSRLSPRATAIKNIGMRETLSEAMARLAPRLSVAASLQQQINEKYLPRGLTLTRTLPVSGSRFQTTAYPTFEHDLGEIASAADIVVLDRDPAPFDGEQEAKGDTRFHVVEGDVETRFDAMTDAIEADRASQELGEIITALHLLAGTVEGLQKTVADLVEINKKVCRRLPTNRSTFAITVASGLIFFFATIYYPTSLKPANPENSSVHEIAPAPEPAPSCLPNRARPADDQLDADEPELRRAA